MTGYSVIATDSPSRHCNRVAVFYWPSPCYAVEAIHHFRPNAIGFHLTTGELRWYIVGCYLTPDDTSTIESVVAALKERPQGAKLLVMGDMNVKLSDMEGYWRGEEIASALITEGMEDMPDHFLLHRRPWYRDGRMCSMVWVGR